jgi:hypothetical protein
MNGCTIVCEYFLFNIILFILKQKKIEPIQDVSSRPGEGERGGLMTRGGLLGCATRAFGTRTFAAPSLIPFRGPSCSVLVISIEASEAE